VYTVSDDGLLALFNIETEEIVWKRRLASGGQDEVFNLQYLKRNLLVHSQYKAMLVNTAGHTNLLIEFATLFGEKPAK